jgi:hypothetical protein
MVHPIRAAAFMIIIKIMAAQSTRHLEHRSLHRSEIELLTNITHNFETLSSLDAGSPQQNIHLHTLVNGIYTRKRNTLKMLKIRNTRSCL